MLKLIKRHPLLSALILGFIFRSLAAFVNYGAVAEDDYANIIEPALRQIYTSEPIATVDYRLEILPHLFYAFMKPFAMMGVDSPALLVSCGYFILGCISLLGIWGMYKLASIHLEAKWRNELTLLYALYFLMPFISTRAFLGSFTLHIIPWAFYFLTKSKDFSNNRYLFWGSFLLGACVVLRFLAAVLVIISSLYFLFLYYQKRISLRALMSFVLGGLASLILFALFDAMSGRIPLSTLWQYVALNFKSNVTSTEYGASPWYNYIGFFLAVMIPPISIIFIFPFISALKKIPLISLNWLGFLFFHSMIANKQERFMLPILPLFFLITFIGIMKYYDKKIIRWAYTSFWILNLLFLLPVSMAKSQMNTIDAAGYLREVEGPIYKKGISFWRQAYLGLDRKEPVSVADIEQLVRLSNAQSSFSLLNFLPLTEHELRKLKENSLECKVKREFEPAFLEKVVIMLNPKRNARRRKTVLYNCGKLL